MYYTFNTIIIKDIAFIILIILFIIDLKTIILYTRIKKYSTI